jgi:hypothetical protein
MFWFSFYRWIEIFACCNSHVEPCVAQGHHPHGDLPRCHVVYSEKSEKRNRAGDEVLFVMTKFRCIETHVTQMFNLAILPCSCDRIERKQMTFARVYIGQSESHGHWTAGRTQSWKCLHCRLSFRFHSIEISTNELVNVVMYRQYLFLNHFQSLWSSLLFFAMHLIFTHFYN